MPTEAKSTAKAHQDPRKEVVAASEVMPPYPLAGKPIPLKTLRQVRLELSRVYNDARRGRIDTQDASRLAFVLSAVAKAIEADELEQRLQALEDQHGR